MTVYIAGPVTGLPDNNKKAFQIAFRCLWDMKRTSRYCDMKIINPLTHVAKRLERQFAAKGKRPEWADYMRACIKKLVEADCVFFLVDWVKSDGATLERYIAKRLGIPIVDNITELLEILEAKK
jgi:nucleoside 2-deoxyribosyltransferase